MPPLKRKTDDGADDEEEIKKTPDERDQFQAQQEKKSQRLAISIDESEYPQGNFDVVSASHSANLRYDELVAIVQSTQDTVLSCDKILENTIFDLISSQNDDGTEVSLPTVDITVPLLPAEGSPRSSVVVVPSAEGKPLAYVIDKDAAPDSTIAVAIPEGGKKGFNYAQLIAAAGARDVRQLIRTTGARSLVLLIKKEDGELNLDRLLKFIKLHDVNDNGLCEKEEWTFLFGEFRNDQIEYYKKLSLLKTHMYLGLGMTPGVDKRMKFKAFGVDAMTLCNCSASFPWAARTFASCFERGFLSDFTYFTANNHPLGVMLFSDPLHPFDERERQADFAAAVATSFFGAALMVFVSGWSAVAKFFVSAAFITIPSTIIKKICFYLFAQPCLVYDESKSSESRNQCLDQVGLCATSCGFFVVVVWSLAFMAVGVLIWMLAWDPSELAYWAYGLIQFWFVWFANMLLLAFNPSKTVAVYIAPCWNKVTCGVVPLSAWFTQRDTVEAVIREKVQARGVQFFTMPGEPRPASGDPEAALGETGAEAVSPIHEP